MRGRGESIPAIVLAAGGSSRLGRPKQLVNVGGEALLCRTVRIAAEAGFAPVLVVLGAEAEACRAALVAAASCARSGTQCTIVENSGWREGMGSSLRCGLAALLASDLRPTPRAVLLLVCDQPLLTVDALRRLGECYDGATVPIAAARYNGRLGTPAIFASELFGELSSVTGDRGARGVLEHHADRVAGFDLPEAAVDVDTPGDLEGL